ncbi:uncharacterized protein LOC118437214 isoform X4 [Folsomia candida]|nr:uncharacterized protein LOC118437214 isoform X4 [Folsomia candida]
MGSAKIILTLIVLTYALLPVLGAPAEGDPLLCLSLPGSPPCNPSGEGHVSVHILQVEKNFWDSIECPRFLGTSLRFMLKVDDFLIRVDSFVIARVNL